MVDYNLELEKAVEVIKKEKAKTVALQLPSGLKPKAIDIVKELQEKTNAEILIWMPGSFGACDIPELPVDLLIQWGHTPWIKSDEH